MKLNKICASCLFIGVFGFASAGLAANPQATPTPIRPTSKSLSALSKQLKSVFRAMQADDIQQGTHLSDLGKTFVDTMATKTNWSGNLFTGTATGVTLTSISVTFTVNSDGNTGTWTSTPISLASIEGGSFSGDWAIFGSAMYLYNISSGMFNNATLLIGMPNPGKPVLSFHLGNLAPPTFITLE